MGLWAHEPIGTMSGVAGWAVAPQADRSHRLTLAASSPIKTPKGGTLRVTLVQGSTFKGHVLGKFRLLTSADPAAVNGTELPAAVLAAAAIDRATRSEAQKRALSDHYVRQVSRAAAAERKQLASAKGMIEALKPVTVPISPGPKPKPWPLPHCVLRLKKPLITKANRCTACVVRC